MKLISNVITLSLLSSSILLGADIDTSKKAITVANVGSLYPIMMFIFIEVKRV